MPSHTPDEIIKMIDDMERARSDLHNRMDGDFDFYNLEPYQGEMDAKGEAVLDNNKKFTSPDPRTAANLALHILSTARRVVRRHKPMAQKEQRQLDNFGEMFDLGMLQAIDERRHKLLMPDLQDSLASQDLFRGRWAQRVLLVKEDIPEDDLEPQIPDQERFLLQGAGFDDFTPPITTRTFVDVMDWDPRNTYWKSGQTGLVRTTRIPSQCTTSLTKPIIPW